jgi:hypothetical protein
MARMGPRRRDECGTWCSLSWQQQTAVVVAIAATPARDVGTYYLSRTTYTGLCSVIELQYSH